MVSFYFGHHKCGSQFFRSLISGIVGPDKHFPYNTIRPISPVELVYIDELDIDNLEVRICKAQETPGSVVSIINTTPRVIDIIEKLCPDYRAFNVVRDPRELLISCYFDHRDSHPISYKDFWHWPELELTKQRLEELNEEDGILFEMKHVFDKIIQVQFNELQPKLDPQKVLTVKLEDYIESPVLTLQSIVDFVHLDAANIDFENVISSGRRHKTDSKRGGWKDVATDNIKNIFYARYKTILTNFQYSNS